MKDLQKNKLLFTYTVPVDNNRDSIAFLDGLNSGVLTLL